MTAGKAFFDASVLVRACDASEPDKRNTARQLLLEHLTAGTARTSTQALAECFDVVTTHGEATLAPDVAGQLIDQLPGDAVVALSVDAFKAAVDRAATGDISIWDATIIEAAHQAGAEILYTEDKRLLRAVENDPGALRAVDPFGKAIEFDWDSVGGEVW